MMKTAQEVLDAEIYVWDDRGVYRVRCFGYDLDHSPTSQFRAENIAAEVRRNAMMAFRGVDPTVNPETLKFGRRMFWSWIAFLIAALIAALYWGS